MGQFGLYILALGKQADGTRFQQRNCVTDEAVERRERAGRHNIETLRGCPGKILDSLRVDNGGKRQFGGCGTQEGGFLLRALDQMDRGALFPRQRAGNDTTAFAAGLQPGGVAFRGRVVEPEPDAQLDE